ncbi:serine hydrolase domain-containing protein, partial [Streptomyces sp. URMC 123]|uniref:serine hydrolase domain-containing protein n=1 Tax=Streptomyces sp. URMC 123 TaxID=3423403 RepID=UPI003F1D19A1
LAAPAPQPSDPVRRALDQVLADGIVGAQVRVVRDGRVRTVRAGSATLNGHRPVPENGRFRIGSVTKTFVATVLLRLAAEGALDLDAPVARYLPGLLPADRNAITVRMVLHHSSGLANYVDALPTQGEAFLRDRFRHHDPRRLIALAAARPPLFPPGGGWEYSDTNYLVAGELIRAVTGRSWETAVTERIIRPLGLHATRAPGDDPHVRGPHARGYLTVGEGDARRAVDITELNPTIAGAAGAMTSSVADLDRFLTALVSGELLPADALAELTRDEPGSHGYGLGITRFDTSCGVTAWGHGGEIHGYLALAATTRGGDRRLAWSLTTRRFGAVESAPLKDSVPKLIDAALCG